MFLNSKQEIINHVNQKDLNEFITFYCGRPFPFDKINPPDEFNVIEAYAESVEDNDEHSKYVLNNFLIGNQDLIEEFLYIDLVLTHLCSMGKMEAGYYIISNED
jgi:hypothetical protein